MIAPPSPASTSAVPSSAAQASLTDPRSPLDASTGAAPIRIAAPAKVNLTLHVTGKRDDGFHLLDSLVVFAGVFDRVSVTPAETLSLTIVGPQAGGLGAVLPQDNIVLKAAEALASATNCHKGAAITLEKALPIAGGIGGGSADAAATLRALMALWDVSLPRASLMALAAGLGADVPVCLRGRPADMSGIGEILQDAVPLPGGWLVLVNPGVHLSTPSVFRARSGDFSPAAPLATPPRDLDELVVALKTRRNDLTAAAISLAPEIGLCLAALTALPGCLLSRMSGSGATCWGLFATEYDARAAARSLRKQQSGWWIEPAPILPATADPLALASEPVLRR